MYMKSSREIGVGPIPKPYQKPHPLILATVVAPYSKGVIAMGEKGIVPNRVVLATGLSLRSVPFRQGRGDNRSHIDNWM